MIGAIGSMSFLTPWLLIQEESDILWKLTLLFPDLRVMVPVSNLIVALAVVRNGVPKMKGLFLFSLISMITKSMENTCSATFTTHSSSQSKGYFKIPSDVLLLCYLLLENRVINRSPQGDRVYILGDGEFGFFPYQYFLRGSDAREFLEKPEHFSHPTVDFLVLLEDGVLKSFHSFGVRSHLKKSPVGCFRDALRCSDSLDWFDEFLCVIPAFMVIEGEVLKYFPRFIGILIAEFAAEGAINLELKMKGDIIIKNLDLKPTIDAMMRDFLKFCGPSRWKELSKESGSKILPCGDGSCWKALKPIASLIAKGKLK
ncbi:hypothetical protein Tco_0077774 [Tanacetum coccineum]